MMGYPGTTGPPGLPGKPGSQGQRGEWGCLSRWYEVWIAFTYLITKEMAFVL
jgi:hypothetical protein